MAKAGAHIVGLNCLFDPFILLETMAMMKKALEDQDLHSYLMCQPLGRSYCAEQTPLTHHWSSSVRALWLEMWRLIGSAPDFWGRGLRFESDIAHNDPVEVQDHCFML